MSTESASSAEHLLDALDYFVMLRQIAAPSGRTAFLYGLDEAGVILYSSIHLRKPTDRLRGSPSGLHADA